MKTINTTPALLPAFTHPLHKHISHTVNALNLRSNFSPGLRLIKPPADTNTTLQSSTMTDFMDIDLSRRNEKPRPLSDAEKQKLEEFVDSIHYSGR
jgi:hypothetical protein